MTEEENVDSGAEETPDELTMLKERADLMGISYHPNIGVDKLKAKITDYQKGDAGDDGEEEEKKPATKKIDKQALRAEALKLVRIRLSNMNQNNANLKGVLVSAGNRHVGFVKKFVPFNAEAGYHVPQIIFDQLKAKRYLTHYEVKVGNKKVTRHKRVPEYAIEVLPPLTDKELAELKQRQMMEQGKG